MKPFAKLFTNLDQSTKANAKLAALLDYFQDASEADCLWMIAILSGRRPKRVVTLALLQDWAIEFAEIPTWLFKESYRVVGDLAETIALVLPPKTRQEDQSLSYWINYMRELVDLEESEKRQKIQATWERLDATERLIFNKLITGGFRISVSQKVIVQALARFTGRPEHVLAHRLVGNWKPEATTFEELLLSENPLDESSKPYPFYLAYALEGEPASLGQPEAWKAEQKWDGIRGQIIVRNDALFVWSSDGELVTDKFPEYYSLAALLPNGTVLDGEIMAFKEEAPLGFQMLQTRIGRKNVTKSMLQEVPVVMICYDLLEWQGQDIRKKTLKERSALLEEFLNSHNTQGILRYSSPISFSNWDQLKKKRTRARQRHSKGLLLKRKDSFYQANQHIGDHWEWKAAPFTIEAVLIYAQPSDGGPTNLFTNFTFAVWKEDQLVPFTKADTGLTDQEFMEISNWVRANTVERFGPVRSVKPKHVFEITFDRIEESKRRKSGVELRAPRISRWYKDKPTEAANTLKDLLALLQQ